MTCIDYLDSYILIFWLSSSKKSSFKINHYVQFTILFLLLTGCCCVFTAGRGRSWEDQPGVSGWEKCPGCDLFGPEALLRQYLPGAASRSLRLSVAPSSGPGRDCPDLELTIALQGRTRLAEMTSAWRRQRGRASWTSVTYTDPVTPGRLFLKCIFFSFPTPRSWIVKQKEKKKTKKDKYGSCDERVRGHFFRFGEQNKKQNMSFWTFSCFYCLFLQLGFIFQKRCTKILIFLLIFVIFMNMCEWPTGCTGRAKVTHTHGHKYQSRLRMKTNNNKRNPAFLLTVSLLAGDHTPSLWRTRRRDAPLEAFIGAGWHLFGETDQPTFALVVSSPFRKDKPLGWVGRVLKTGIKNKWILTF